MSHDSIPIGVGTGVAVIGLASIPALTSFVLQLRKKEPRQNFYEDGDGKATPESMAAYSARLPKAVILVLAAIGFACSMAAVLNPIQVASHGIAVEDWLIVAAWGLILFQAISICSMRDSVQAYELGIYSFMSSVVLGGLLVVQDTEIMEDLLHSSPVSFALRIVEISAVCLLIFASLAIPRRPDVYQDGKQVDRMLTATAFSRFTFAWPRDLLSLSVKKKNLDLIDLARPDQYTRTKEVSADWHRRNYKTPLWISIARAHGFDFALQWVLTLAASFLNFAPQWVILQLLRILENRTPGQTFGLDTWIWVLWLGVVIIAQSWVESWTFWLSWAGLAIPVRSQLSALIFEKAMRRKDVKGASKKKEVKSADPTVAAPAGEANTTEQPEVEDEAEILKKTKQTTVNLIGVDCKRVSDFCSYQNYFPGSLFKLVVSLAFLTSLLGWQALLAGFSTMIAIMPINIFFSKKYSAAQDRLMNMRDEKLEVVNEALQGIRQIKFSALEPEWEKKVGDVRARELKCVWDVFVADAMLLACWVTSPIMLSAVSLAVYAYLHGELVPSVAFVSLGVFRALEVTLSVVPELTTDLLDAWISIKRIDKYLKSPDVEMVSQDAPEIAFENASIAWPADEKIDEEDRFVLRNVSVTFPKGELSVISGKTGTGKSLMLSAILGEVDVLSGKLYMPRPPKLEDRHDAKAHKGNWILENSVAYVAQIPWIENASIKDNITFGLPVDEDRYAQTIEVCALKKDLQMLSDGEQTEIGANGINLSGGQKWRVTLARAIYSRAGILVLDDIFSAVDAHVGRHIFEKCLNGELCKGRTRILVTHHVSLVEPKTKYLVELGDGGVLHEGLLSELAEDGILQKIKSHEQTEEEIQDDDTAAATAVNSDSSSEELIDGDALKKVASKNQARKFVEEEKREEGAVRRRIYATYLKDSGGLKFWTVAISIFFINQALNVGRSWWLRVWTGSYETENAGVTILNATQPQHSYGYVVGLQQTANYPSSVHGVQHHEGHGLNYYLGIYVALALIASVMGTAKYFWIYIGSVRASKTLFEKIAFVILRAPLRWLDTVPVGRILNRFTADFHIIDSQLANSFSFGFNSFTNVLGVIVAGLFVSGYIVLLSLVLLFICCLYALRYLSGARPVKRLESNAKSPVFEQFGSALSGVATIRSFDKSQAYIQRMYGKLDDWATTSWHLWLFNRWVGWRMSLVGSVYSVVVAVVILLSPGMDSALAGFALAFALEFANCVMWTVRLYANVELNMNAAERIIEYTELPTESLEGEHPPAAWPTQGSIDVDNLVVSYAPDLPPVLKGLSFRINGKERVGVIGRTGAGKSSLTLAFFRFLEARSGSIHIDGQDISKIKLHDLRSRLAIIPQDPVLFSGTVRSNLDPFDNHTDVALKDCLERVHLTSSSASTSGTATPTGTHAPKNTNIFADLTSAIAEGGLNLSQGQRQLLCLARAIVSRPRVMVLDEATSAVDMATDALIQRSIREEFTDATLVVIAHRLSTIADFDRILVLSDGKVAEFGSPRELWNMGPEGIFRGMCEESGEREKLRGIVFGEE